MFKPELELEPKVRLKVQKVWTQSELFHSEIKIVKPEHELELRVQAKVQKSWT